jgi:hypothetical protein
MKKIIAWVLLGVISSFGIGYVVGQHFQKPTVENCLDICAEEFEKYAC